MANKMGTKTHAGIIGPSLINFLGVKTSCFLGWDRRLDVAASSMPDNQYKYIK
jgi:hypothetical protein